MLLRRQKGARGKGDGLRSVTGEHSVKDSRWYAESVNNMLLDSPTAYLIGIIHLQVNHKGGMLHMTELAEVNTE
jgi:hypothetical protein